LSNNNDYPHGDFGSNDLPGYSDYKEDSDGAPAFPDAAANNGAMFGNDRPGAWKRLLALIIDNLLLQVILGGCLMAAICGQDLKDWYDALDSANSPEEANELFPSGKLAIWGLIMVVVWLTYRVLMESKKGATLGKMAIGARVISADGQNLTPVESLKRNGWYIIGTVLVLIPLVGSYLALALYIVVGVTIGRSPEKQSFTDKLAKAYVVNK